MSSPSSKSPWWADQVHEIHRAESQAALAELFESFERTFGFSRALLTEEDEDRLTLSNDGCAHFRGPAGKRYAYRYRTKRWTEEPPRSRCCCAIA